METAEERDARVQQLEADRAKRKGEAIWPTRDDATTSELPVEIAPGRGDLRYSSWGGVDPIPIALQMVGNRTVSFNRLFMTQPMIAGAVMRMLTWAARVPLKAYRRTGPDSTDKERLRPGDHPVADMVDKPWSRGSSVGLTMAALGPVLVHGNSVIRILQSRNGNSVTLIPKDWRYVMPIMPWRGSLEGFTFDTDQVGLEEDVAIDQVLHTAWWSPGGPIGVSPLQQLGITMQIEDALQRFARAFLQNGTRPPSALTVSEAFLGLDPEERKTIMAQLREDLVGLYAGPENAGKPALLPPGLDWKAVGQTTVEAGLIDQRKVNAQEVCTVYQIAPPLLGILDHATYTNLSEQRESIYTETLGPPLVLIEQTITSQLCRDLLMEPDIFVEYDFGAVLRGNRAQEIVSLREAIASALISPNEGRNVLNLQRSDEPGMDDYWLPKNNLSKVQDAPPQRRLSTLRTCQPRRRGVVFSSRLGTAIT